MQFEDFETQLHVLLRSAGPETVAELTDAAIAYWNGQRLVYATVDADGTGTLTGACALDAGTWPEWKDWLADWLADPVLSVRHDLPHEP
ncbi:hypothetical protein CBA19CS91_41145 [Paraburkholderia hospita]|nr:hypothetical protein CBA19CS91_41145 [Paraburkholderia hospita]